MSEHDFDQSDVRFLDDLIDHRTLNYDFWLARVRRLRALVSSYVRDRETAPPKPSSGAGQTTVVRERKPSACDLWNCDGDHKYYLHDPQTGELVECEDV